MTDHKEYTPEDFDDPSDFIAWFQNPELFSPENLYRKKVIEAAIWRLRIQINNVLRLSLAMPFSAIMNYDYDSTLISFINANYEEILDSIPVPKNASRISITEFESTLRGLVEEEVVKCQESLQSFRNERIKFWASNLFDIPTDICWRDYIKTLDSRPLLERILSLQSEYDKRIDNHLELTIEDYLNAWNDRLNEIKTERKASLGYEVFYRYKNYIMAVLARGKEQLYDKKEWTRYRVEQEINEDSISALVEVLLSNSSPQSIKYWVEFSLYEHLVNGGYYSNDCRDHFNKIIHPFLQTRTLEIVDTEDKLDFNEDDYSEWCGLFLKDEIQRRGWREEQRSHDEYEKYQHSIQGDQKYDQYEAPSDGYDGYLDDDYINDALGGDPDAYNID